MASIEQSSGRGMTMKRWILVALAAAMIAGCGRDAVMGSKPVGHGQSALHGKDRQSRKRVEFKLGNIGSTETWPLVLASLHDADPRIRA